MEKVAFAPGETRGRSRSSAGSILASSSMEEEIARAGPSRSSTRTDWTCGSHLAHSHCESWPSPASTAMRTSSGDCIVAIPSSIERARDRTAFSSPPVISTRE